LYKSCASQSGLKGAEVAVEIVPLPGGEITVQETGVTIEEIVVDPIAVQHASQKEWQGATHRVSLGSELAKTNSKALNPAMVTYLREMKQQLNDKVELYIIHLTTCCLTHASSWQLRFS
jgi:hypothetical protein